MKAAQLRELSTNELSVKLKENKELLFRYRFQVALGHLDNPMKFKQAKREIARIHTILAERERSAASTDNQSSH